MQRVVGELDQAPPEAAPLDVPGRAQALSARWLPVATILLAPLLGVLLLRAPLVNALIYRDPWFYSGHGWGLSHFIEVYGWFYYAVRFPATLPIGWMTDLFGPEAGYILLRYLILAGTGWALYACVRRFASVSVACAGVMLLMLNPFFMRLVLWDYTSFVALPASIAAAAVWFLGATPRRRWLTAGVSGFLFCAATFANPLAVFVIPALYAVEALAAVRLGFAAMRELVVRWVFSALGAVLCFLGGYLGYAAHLGAFPVTDLITPTLDFVRANDQLAAPFQIPAREWLQHEPRVYTPLIAGLAVAVVMGRRLLATDIAARVAQFALAYTAITWLYRKFVTSSGIETWWAYSMTAITVAFALPAVLHELGRERPRIGRATLAAALIATALTNLLLRSFNERALSLYDSVRTHVVVLILLLLVIVAAIVALRLLRGVAGRAVATAVFAVGLAFFALTPAEYIGIRVTGEFSPFSGAAELAGYDAAHEMTEILDREDEPEARVLMWSSMAGIANMAWTGMPHQQGGIEDPEMPVPITTLTPGELKSLRYPTTRGVLVFDEDARAVANANALLRRNGFRTVVRSRGTWADGRMAFTRIDIVGKP